MATMEDNCSIGSKTVVTGTPLPKNSCDSALQDSGFISPPTVVRFEPETPCHYFLRGQAKFASTPLPVSESFATTPLPKSSSSPHLSTVSTPHNFVTDFQKRLDTFEDGLHEDELGFQEPDSGFESLINSTSDESSEGGGVFPANLESRDARRGNFGHLGSNYSSPTTLGAIPKRRSPRQVALGNKVDGIERLTRIKTGKRNLNVVKELEKTQGGEESFHVPDIAKFTSKKGLLKPPGLFTKEGRSTCDLLRYLYERNMSVVLNGIFKCLSPEDLCRVSQVSQLWNLSLACSKYHEERRLNFVACMRANRENAGVFLRSKVVSPRRVMQEVANITASPSSGKRDRNPSSAAIVSPSKIRHKLFVDEARKLTPGESLVHCPLCTSPSRVSFAQKWVKNNTPAGSSQNLQNFPKAQCSSPKCSFEFCPDCQCEEHTGRSCRVTRTGSKVPKSGAVTSKKSKARLRRL